MNEFKRNYMFAMKNLFSNMRLTLNQLKKMLLKKYASGAQGDSSPFVNSGE